MDGGGEQAWRARDLPWRGWRAVLEGGGEHAWRCSAALAGGGGGLTTSEPEGLLDGRCIEKKNRGKMDIFAFAGNLMRRKVDEAVDGVTPAQHRDETGPM